MTWVHAYVAGLLGNEFEEFCADVLATLPEYRSLYRPFPGEGRRDDGIDARIDHPDGSLRIWFCFTTRQRGWIAKFARDLRATSERPDETAETVVCVVNADVDRQMLRSAARELRSLVRKPRVVVLGRRELVSYLLRPDAAVVLDKWAIALRAGNVVTLEPLQWVTSLRNELSGVSAPLLRQHLRSTLAQVLPHWKEFARTYGSHRAAAYRPETRLEFVVTLNFAACLATTLGERLLAYDLLLKALDAAEDQAERACVLSNLLKVVSEIPSLRWQSKDCLHQLSTLLALRPSLRVRREAPLHQLGWATERGIAQNAWDPTGDIVMPCRYAGYALLYVGDYRGAEALFSKSVHGHERTSSPDAWLGLAYLARDRGDEINARRYVDAALNRLGEQPLRPEHHLQYSACAFVYGRDYERALSLLERLGHLAPEHLHFARTEPHYNPLRAHCPADFNAIVRPRH